MFRGEYEHTIDPKGRIKLPSKFWDILQNKYDHNLIITKCIPEFLNHDKWKMNFTEILYSAEGGHELFENHIKSLLNNYLKDNAVIITKDGTPYKPEEVISITEEISKFISSDDLKILFPNKKVIHRECKPDYHLGIENIDMEIYDFIKSTKGQELINIKADKNDIEWFKKLYSSFVDKYNHSFFSKKYARYNVEFDNFWNKMRSLNIPIIFTTNNNLERIEECYINPNKINVPEQLSGELNIVHPKIEEDERFEKFRYKLNSERYHYVSPDKKVIKKLTQEDIKDALNRIEFLKMDKMR